MDITHLDVAKRLFGHKVDGDGKEIVCVTSDSELHGAGLVGSIDHGQTPFQDVLPTVVPVISLTFSDNRSTSSRPGSQHKERQE